jgi:protocatechuate 3,4-dioxygenase alpha subunit
VPDALLEVWQADFQGRFVDSPLVACGTTNESFQGFARMPTDERGSFHFRTVRPGAVPLPNGAFQAPHIVVLLLMRGILRHLITRIYFADDPLNDADPVLTAVPMERRCTLLAQPMDERSGLYRWDICLQGDDETVFFAY